VERRHELSDGHLVHELPDAGPQSAGDSISHVVVNTGHMLWAATQRLSDEQRMGVSGAHEHWAGLATHTPFQQFTGVAAGHVVVAVHSAWRATHLGSGRPAPSRQRTGRSDWQGQNTGSATQLLSQHLIAAAAGHVAVQSASAVAQRPSAHLSGF
jgi:hypothetical protein